MANGYEGSELGGIVERGEATFLRSFHSAIECIKEGVGRNESYERHSLPVFELLFEAIEHRLESLGETVHALGESVRALEPVLGEWATRLGDGCDLAEASLKQGVEWLKEHRDVLEATAKLIVLVALAVEAPEIALGMIARDPAVLSGPLDTVATALANA